MLAKHGQEVNSIVCNVRTYVRIECVACCMYVRGSHHSNSSQISDVRLNLK